MKENFQTTALSSQLQLDHALYRFRHGTDVALPPLKDSNNFEQESMVYIQTLKKRRHNKELVQYFMIAQNILDTNRPFKKSNIIHRAGLFLLEYFKDEHLAINFLEGISLKNLDRLTNEAKRKIIREKPLRTSDLPHFEQALSDNGADDLWHHAINSVEDQWFPDPIDLPEEASPEPLFRKRRRTSHQSERTLITSPGVSRPGTPNPLGISQIRAQELLSYDRYQVFAHPQTGLLTIDYHL